MMPIAEMKGSRSHSQRRVRIRPASLLPRKWLPQKDTVWESERVGREDQSGLFGTGWE